MTLTITPDPAQSIVPPDFNFTALWNGAGVITTPGVNGTPYVVDDATVFDESSAETRQEGLIVTDPPDAAEKMQFSSDNAAVATVDAAGYVRSITDGTTTIRCTRKHVRRAVAITAVVDEVQTITKLQSYSSGTLGKHIKDSAAALLAVSQQTNIYSSGTTRNPNVWTGSLDLTGVAYSNTTSGGAQRAGTLISPRHIVMAKHYRINVGATITFVTQDGTVVERTIEARQDIGSVVEYPTERDTTIGKLNADVPETIKWYKLMGAASDWQEYLTLYSNSDLPIIAFDQERKVLHRLRQLYPWGFDDAQRALLNTNCFAHFLANEASENIVSGDSGQPCFHPINGELVLLGFHTGTLFGYLLGAEVLKSEIDAAMTSLGGGYTSTDFDLSGFNNYG